MRFNVISLHYTRKCDLNCPFCYRSGGNGGGEKPRTFFLELIKYIRGLTPQIACGGGEPLLDPEFIRNMGKECKKHNLIFNFTTNGKLFLSMNEQEIKETLRNVTMISISLDTFKWGKDLEGYAKVCKKVKKLTNTQIGSNLLVEPKLFDKKGLNFVYLINWLFNELKIDRVFALYPKMTRFRDFVDIIKYKGIYDLLTYKYPMFFVDDCTKQILQQGYTDWKSPCHYGRSLISIDEKGSVSGCSFEEKKVFKLENPEDVLLIKDYQFENRYYCPFIL